MKTKLLLRVAAGLMIFHMLGHTFGHLNWKVAIDPEKKEVIRQMTEHKFPFMGKDRSMADYYEGYGWAGTITLILMGAILWIVSGAVNENKKLSMKVSLTIAMALTAWCIMEFLFFFPFAACITLAAAILTLLATWKLRDQKKYK